MSFRAPPQAKVLNIFQEWHVGFHGTRASSVQPILNNGSLLMAGKDNFNSASRETTSEWFLAFICIE